MELQIFDLDLYETLNVLLSLGIALLLGAPIGWERGKGPKSIGMRTFPIVSIASCGFILLAKDISHGEPSIIGSTIQGMLSGIGFIGGGAILKLKGNVQGIVTAASIWNTAAIGICVGFERLEISIILSIINFLILYFLTPISKKGLLDPEGGLFQPTDPNKEPDENAEEGVD